MCFPWSLLRGWSLLRLSESVSDFGLIFMYPLLNRWIFSYPLRRLIKNVSLSSPPASDLQSASLYIFIFYSLFSAYHLRELIFWRLYVNVSLENLMYQTFLYLCNSLVRFLRCNYLFSGYPFLFFDDSTWLHYKPNFTG